MENFSFCEVSLFQSHSNILLPSASAMIVEDGLKYVSNVSV